MKKKFEILEDRPTLKIRVTRDSVCAADDCFVPHEKTIEVHSFLDPVALASHLGTACLPKVTGSGHTWDCVLNGGTIATISVRDVQSKVDEVNYEKENHVHFKYHSANY